MSKQSSQRLPAPSLFVGPPSHNASNVSLTRANTDTSQTSRTVPSSAIPGPASPSLNSSSLSRSNTAASRNANPLSRQTTNLSRQNTQRDAAGLSRQNTNLSQTLPRPDGLQVPDDNGTTGEKTGGGVGLANTTIDEEVKRQRPRRGTAVLDAHWAALQSTLSDIELSAGSSAHVFGTGHAKALEELRAAQVELARAWGQTDSEDTSTLPSKETKSPETNAQQRNSKEHNTKETQEKHQSNNHKEQEKQAEQNERKLSTATTLDLTSAARRREASDKYFAAVKEGVAEVVRKLDGVADAMREVEMQSRDIWGDDGKDSSEMTESEFGSLSS
ncbi:hypothetical protein KCU65_g1896, partial [Aureobasidium melanogenum]